MFRSLVNSRAYCRPMIVKWQRTFLLLHQRLLCLTSSWLLPLTRNGMKYNSMMRLVVTVLHLTLSAHKQYSDLLMLSTKRIIQQYNKRLHLKIRLHFLFTVAAAHTKAPARIPIDISFQQSSPIAIDGSFFSSPLSQLLAMLLFLLTADTALSRVSPALLSD